MAIVFKAKSYMVCEAPSDLAPACAYNLTFCLFHRISLCSGHMSLNVPSWPQSFHGCVSFQPEESSLSAHLPFPLASQLSVNSPGPGGDWRHLPPHIGLKTILIRNVKFFHIMYNNGNELIFYAIYWFNVCLPR